MTVPETPKNADAPPDRARFMEMVRRCEMALLRAARRLCRSGSGGASRYAVVSEDCAQDLVQDALVRGYEAYRQGRFREGSSPQAWFLRILTNGFINEHRRRTRWEAGVTVDTLTAQGAAGPPSTHAAASETPERALLADTLDEPLERALVALPESLRLCLLLVDVEEYSYAEAAETLGVPVGTVRSRLSRARFQLQESLHDYAKDRGLL